MERIKALNGYTIMRATARDVKKYNVTEGNYYIYFSSDLRDYGLANSDADWETDSLVTALEWCVSTNYAAAKEIAESRSTAASFEEIEEIESQLDAGMTAEEIEEEYEEDEITMKEYIIEYGKGRPGGNIECRAFETYRDAFQYAADNARGWGFNITPGADLVSVDELAADLDTGDHGDALNDYRDSSTYISDAIHEAADQRTSIYYSDIMAFVSEHPDALADVVAEGLYDPSHNYDLYAHGQAAEYMTIYNDIWNHLEDALMIAAVDFLRYDLKRQYIPAELADYLKTWVTDPGDRMNDIPDRIRDYFGDMEGGSDHE